MFIHGAYQESYLDCQARIKDNIEDSNLKLKCCAFAADTDQKILSNNFIREASKECRVNDQYFHGLNFEMSFSSKKGNILEIRVPRHLKIEPNNFDTIQTFTFSVKCSFKKIIDMDCFPEITYIFNIEDRLFSYDNFLDKRIDDFKKTQERPRPKQQIMWPYYLMIILAVIMAFLQIKSRLHYQEYQELFVKSEQEYFRDCLANNSYEECNYRNVNSNDYR